METLLSELNNHVLTLTFNHAEKHNAFDGPLLQCLQQKLDEGIGSPDVKIIVLKAKGQHFSAGADLDWMRRMADFNETENHDDAMVLARVLFTLHQSPKPTVVVAQGSSFGGGAGLIAACDIAIAAENAHFCFPETRLGLIPAVISPYVVRSLGERIAAWLFMSAQIINADKACQLGLIQYVAPQDKLEQFTEDFLDKLTHLAPEALLACKPLVKHVSHHPLNAELIDYTASLLAKKRVSDEGQHGLQAFLNKTKPRWS
ncbi:MAG: enoyl-CoA hydratase/isomerase family protein [Legionella sp.]|nr:enoyl-CoA hydratase/isomerase family protein [Legionella sp.]